MNYKYLLGIFCVMLNQYVSAQHIIHDSLPQTNTIVHEDERIGILGSKMAEYNLSLSKKIQMVSGYRLMLLNTTDRNQAMQLRSTLLQKYPEQKVYTTFLAPYIKLKFGNFLTRDEAMAMKKNFEKLKLVTGNIYVVSELVEKKPEEKKAGED